jgi:protein-L-isoaspartate(D-aspartate) O-methyltransferase
MKELNCLRYLEKRGLPDLPEARQQMVASLRTEGHSEATLAAMAVVPRHAFAPAGLWRLGYAMMDLWGPTQYVPSPRTIALMLDNLKLETAQSVLEFGTESGYLSALLGLLVERVYTVELDPAKLWLSSDAFRELGLDNIRQKCADGRLGWPELAPFDRIVIPFAVPWIQDEFSRQTAAAGAIMAPVGPYAGPQRLTRSDLSPLGPLITDLGPCTVPPLAGVWAGVAAVPPPSAFAMADAAAPFPDDAATPAAGAWQVWAA